MAEEKEWRKREKWKRKKEKRKTGSLKEEKEKYKKTQDRDKGHSKKLKVGKFGGKQRIDLGDENIGKEKEGRGIEEMK